MPTNETRLELLKRVKASRYPGSITEVFQASDQGIDLVEQHQAQQQQQQQQQQMQVANTPQQQEIGLREQHAMGNTQASMAFPDVQPNQSFNTVGMAAPIDIQKIDDQGHLVESYENVPPGIQDLPTGPSEGTIIESPAAYQKGGLRMIDPNAEEGMGAKVGEKHQYEIEYKTNDDFENVLSFAPGTGEVIDAKNTVVDVINKDYTGAALNAAGFMIPFIPGGILKKGYKFLKNKVKVPHKPGPSSKINFIDNVKDRVKKDAESGLNYYGRKEFPTNPDLTLTQKNLASHLDKTGKGGTTSLYRYGDEVLDNRGKSSWYSADPIDPFRYESMRGSGKKVFKIDAENAFLSDMYRGGPQQGTGFKSLTEFKEFEVPDWMTGKFGNQQTFDSMTDYKKHLNKLKQTGGFNSAYQKGGVKIPSYDLPEDLQHIHTGVDDKLSINPRVYRALDDVTNIIDPPTEETRRRPNVDLIGYEHIADAARRRGVPINQIIEVVINENRKTNSTNTIKKKGLSTILKGTDKLSDEEFQGLNTEVQNIAQGFENVKSISGAMLSFGKSDLSGIKEYREKMGLSRQDILDLIQSSETANIWEKGKIGVIKEGLKLKKWQKGGLRKYQNGGWDNFEKSKVGKFIDAKGLRQEKDFWMEQFGYEPGKEEKDAVLDAAAIVNPVPDFIHAATKAQEGKYTDAALYAGFGILPFSAGPLVRGTKKYIINPVKNLFKSKPKFKSDIDWGKFNKEIPGNTALMDEYKHIEEITKSRGTWMKNADASKFKGTPEQFIQAKSKNFNLAYPEGYQSVYRGVDKAGTNTLRSETPYSKYTSSTGKSIPDHRDQYTGIFTGDKRIAGSYGDKVHNLAMRNSPNSLKIEGLGSGWGDLHSIGVSKKALKKNIDKLEKQLNTGQYMTHSGPVTSAITPPIKPQYHGGYDAAAQLKSYKSFYNNYDEIIANPKYKKLVADREALLKSMHGKDLYSTDDAAKFLQREGLDNIQIKYIDDMMYGDVNISNQVPGNYLKNLEGNRGTFDLTSPNPDFEKGGFKSKYQVGGERQSPIMMESPIGLQPTQTDIDVKKIRDTYNTDKNPLRADMMTHLDTTGRDTTYVNSVISHISQHESKGDPTSQQEGGGPGRGMFQYEEGSKKGGNTAINNTMNFLKKYSPTRKNALHTRDNPVYEMHKGTSADLSKLDKSTQEGIFIGDKIYGGTVQRDAFDKLVKNRETTPTSDEMFEFWGKHHKRVFVYKDKDGEDIKYLWDKLPADKKEIEKKKWRARTNTIKRKGGYKSKYYL